MGWRKDAKTGVINLKASSGLISRNSSYSCTARCLQYSDSGKRYHRVDRAFTTESAPFLACHFVKPSDGSSGLVYLHHYYTSLLQSPATSTSEFEGMSKGPIARRHAIKTRVDNYVTMTGFPSHRLVLSFTSHFMPFDISVKTSIIVPSGFMNTDT
jgi:hypothetical protein